MKSRSGRSNWRKKFSGGRPKISGAHRPPLQVSQFLPGFGHEAFGRAELGQGLIVMNIVMAVQARVAHDDCSLHVRSTAAAVQSQSGLWRVNGADKLRGAAHVNGGKIRRSVEDEIDGSGANRASRIIAAGHGSGAARGRWSVVQCEGGCVRHAAHQVDTARGEVFYIDE